MKVERSRALELCQQLGLKAADGWTNSVMGKKLMALPTMKDLNNRKKELEDKEVKNLLKAVLGACEEENTINVVDDAKKAKTKAKVKDEEPEEDDEEEVDDADNEDDEEEEEEEADEEAEDSDDEEESEDDDEVAEADDEEEDVESDEDEESDDDDTESDDDEDEESEDEEDEDEDVEDTKKTPAKKNGKPAAKPAKGKPAKPEKKKVAKKKEEVAKDAWGSRIGTRAAKINKVLIESPKPLSMKEIVLKSKASSVGPHIYTLKTNGFIKKDKNNKYFRVKKK